MVKQRFSVHFQILYNTYWEDNIKNDKLRSTNHDRDITINKHVFIYIEKQFCFQRSNYHISWEGNIARKK